MNYGPLFFIVIVPFIIVYCGHRAWLSMIITTRVRSTSARKKRYKGQSFKEWIFYTRFRDVLPKFSLYANWGIIIYFLIALIGLTVLRILKIEYETARIICLLHLIPYGILGAVFWIMDLVKLNPKNRDPNKVVEFWYGNKKKKKKK